MLHHSSATSFAVGMEGESLAISNLAFLGLCFTFDERQPKGRQPSVLQLALFGSSETNRAASGQLRPQYLVLGDRECV